MSQSGEKNSILRASKLSNFGGSSSGTVPPPAARPSSASAATTQPADTSSPSRRLFSGLKASKLAVGGAATSGSLKSANNPFGSSGTTPSSTNPFLRTSGVTAEEKKPVCTPSAPNPFAKFGKDDCPPVESSSNPFKPKLPKSGEGGSSKEEQPTAADKSEQDEATAEKASPQQRQKLAEEEEAEEEKDTKVQPDKGPADDPAAPPSSSEEGGSFVFGQNLADRAANFAPEGGNPAKSTTGPAKAFTFGQNLTARAEPPAPDGDGEVVTADNNRGKEGDEKKPEAAEAAAAAAAAASPEAAEAAAAGPSKTLSENAEDFMNNKSAQKRKYDEVEVTTGEENECNVIHTRAKLYFFENSNWVERGRGQLRLNDMTVEAASATDSKTGSKINNKVSSSRLVMRTMGALKVILNTKVYKGMSVEQPNEKSVRMTGMDESGAVKVFLVMCSPKDAGALYKALKSRLAELNRPQSEPSDAASKRLKNASSLSSEQDDDSSTSPRLTGSGH